MGNRKTVDPERGKQTRTEEDEKLIAYCGLYCGDCFGHKGNLADQARDLRKDLRDARFDKTAEALSKFSFFEVFRNYPQCYEVLGALVKLRCKRACRGGGGNPSCKVRRCCQRKDIRGCWECGEFKTCTKLDFLRENHGDAHIRNLRMLQRKGVEEFLKGKKHWYCKPREAAKKK